MTPQFDPNWFLQQADEAVRLEIAQRRAQLLRRFEQVVRTELRVQGPFTAAEYPSADVVKGKLLIKPGEKLVHHIWGTQVSRTEPWIDGAEADIGFFVSRDLVLVVSDRADTPPGRARFRAHITGFVESLG